MACWMRNDDDLRSVTEESQACHPAFPSRQMLSHLQMVPVLSLSAANGKEGTQIWSCIPSAYDVYDVTMTPVSGSGQKTPNPGEVLFLQLSQDQSVSLRHP